MTQQDGKLTRRFLILSRGRAILKNDWNEVVDLILKPRPGGKK